MSKIVKMTNVSFHGECSIVRASCLGIDKLPVDAKLVERDKHGRLLVAHSESGHHHYVMEPKNKVNLYTTNNPLIKFFKVELGANALLKHLKPENDTQRHDTQKIGPGLYRVSIQREFTPEGWRRVED